MELANPTSLVDHVMRFWNAAIIFCGFKFWAWKIMIRWT
jgi:hypothetical protein